MEWKSRQIGPRIANSFQLYHEDFRLSSMRSSGPRNSHPVVLQPCARGFLSVGKPCAHHRRHQFASKSTRQCHFLAKMHPIWPHSSQAHKRPLPARQPRAHSIEAAAQPSEHAPGHKYPLALDCVFRSIRPLIPTTSGHLFRGIRPPVTRCREAVGLGYQV